MEKRIEVTYEYSELSAIDVVKLIDGWNLLKIDYNIKGCTFFLSPVDFVKNARWIGGTRYYHIAGWFDDSVVRLVRDRYLKLVHNHYIDLFNFNLSLEVGSTFRPAVIPMLNKDIHTWLTETGIIDIIR